MNECFNCSSYASYQYDIGFAETVLEGKMLCDDCITTFERDKQIEIKESVTWRWGLESSEAAENLVKRPQ